MPRTGTLKALLRLDAELMRGLGPQGELRFQKLRRILRRANALRIELEAELGRKLAHLLVARGFGDRPVELLDNVSRRAGRRHHHEPPGEIEARQRLATSRPVWRRHAPVRRRGRKRAQCAASHMRLYD